MANTKRHFISGKMNKGVDERLVPNGEYIDALNVRLGSTEQSEIGSVENSKGNTQLTTLEFDGNALSSNARCIGAFEDGTRETIYWFIHDRGFTGINPAGAPLDLIVSLNVKEDILTYHVISTSVLNFNPTYLITGIDMVEDFLFFTDDYNAPRFIDINKNYPEPSGGVDQFTAEELLVIKRPPLTAPTFVLSETESTEDYIEERFLCFAYRYRYENNQYSATSPFSKPAFASKPFSVSISSFLNEGMVNSKNLIQITFNTGGLLVKGIDLLFKESGTNIIKVIQKLDKKEDGLADNTDYSFEFGSNKIFTILPDSELLRLFDNVPRFAKAQTVMGNRLMYGNYVDGYNLKDLNGRLLRTVFDTNLVSEEQFQTGITASLQASSYSLDTAVSQNLSQITLDFTNILLKQGNIIDITFNISHGQFSNSTSPGDIPTNTSTSEVVNFFYQLPQDFNTLSDLVSSQDFQDRVGIGPPTPPGTGGTIKPVYDPTNPTSCSGTTFTDNFNCVIPETLTGDGAPVATWTKHASGISATGQGISATVSGDDLIFQIVSMEYVDNVAAPSYRAYEYYEVANVNAVYQSSSSSLSLHSNRNYEVGIIYMDDFARATTALVSSNNSIHIPCANSIFKNSIKVTIPPEQIAPSFATRYKFCIKPDLEGYTTVYSSIYFKPDNTQDLNTYFLLEGENAQKVEEGDRLIVKADATGARTGCTHCTVLEKTAQTENFIVVTDEAGDSLFIPSGVYMKINVSNFSAFNQGGALIIPGLQSHIQETQNDFAIVEYKGLSGDPDASGNYSPSTIPAGSRIKLTLKFERRGYIFPYISLCPERKYELQREYVAPNNSTDIVQWWFDNNIIESLKDCTSCWTTNDGEPVPNQVNLPTISAPSPVYTPSPGDGKTYFYTWMKNTTTNEITFVVQGTRACGSPTGSRGDAIVEVSWQVIRTENNIIFETEPSDALADVWYESSESYAIDQSTGYHQGSDGVYQTSTTPAIVNTDFANCFSFGNGAESFRIRDSIKGKAFDLGERFFSTSAEDYKEADRFAALTYSGVFNTETNVNKLNEFNLGILNFKNLEESFGAIQIISGRETDILTLQEDKISYVQEGKNLLSDAAGGSAVTSVPEVLGTQIARVEEYGISSNPESFVQYGYDKFFTDAKRGALIQLRGSGRNEQLTVLSEFGMRSWFRDLFLGSFDTQKLGAFDPYMNEFVLASNTQKLPTEPVVVSCGVQRRLTVTSASPVSFTVNVGDTVGTCAISYNIISFSDPGSITIAEDYTGTSTNINTTGVGTFNFTKNSVSDEDVVITLTPASAPPGGKQVVVLDITVGCPQAQQITLIEVCVSKDSQVGDTIHNQYQWTDGSTFVSPLHSKRVRLALGDGNAGTEEVSDYTVITAPQGGGIIPNNGDTLSIISNKRLSDSFVFDSTSGTPNRLMFLRSATLYNNTPADITALLAAATSLPLTGATPIVTGTVTLPAVGADQYMYIIYDYFT